MHRLNDIEIPERLVENGKKTTTHGIPSWSPTQVLTRPTLLQPSWLVVTLALGTVVFLLAFDGKDNADFFACAGASLGTDSGRCENVLVMTHRGFR